METSAAFYSHHSPFFYWMEKDDGCDDGGDCGGGEREGNEKWKENLLRFLIFYLGFKLRINCVKP